MPLLFTTAPEPLTNTDPEYFGGGAFFVCQMLGPWQVGSARYAGGVRGINGAPTIGKRSGSSWTFPDEGNAPTQKTFPTFPQFLYDGPNQLIHILCASESPDFFLRYCAYDIASDTYGSIVDSTLVAVRYQWQQRSDGDLIVAFGANSGDDLQYVVISVGAFGSSGTIDAGAVDTSKLPLDAVIDSDDVLHIGYRVVLTTPFPPDADLVYVTLDATNTPGTPATVATVTSGTQSQGLSPGLIRNDEILWLYTTTANDSEVFLAVGTPVAAPVWTLIPVASRPDQNVATLGGSLAVFDSSVYMFFPDNDFTDETSQMLYSVYDGATVTTPDIAWNAVTNPAFPGLADADYTCAVPSVRVNGSVLEMLAQTEVAIDTAVALCYLIGEAVPPVESFGYSNSFH